MGVGGGLVLVTVHAVLADHHGELRTVALAEENVAASIAYLALIGALSVAAALQLGWRAALLASWSSRSWPGAAAGGSRLTRRTHHLSWGTPPRRVLDRGRNAVLHHRRRMVRHRLGCDLRHGRRRCVTRYRGRLDGRLLRSRAAAPDCAGWLLAIALGITAAGFAILWPSTAPAPAMIGLSLMGIGLGNLFPMGVSLAVALAPGRSALASGRVVAMSSFAVVLAPLTVGTLADATSLKAALGVVPVMVALAAAGLALIGPSRTRTQASSAPKTADAQSGP